MRRIEKMVQAAGGLEAATKPGALRPLVQMISHRTCLRQSQVYDLLRALKLEQEVFRVTGIPPERSQPTTFIEALRAPDPVALATRAIDEEWTAGQVRLEAARLRMAASNGGEPPPLPKGRYGTIVVDPPLGLRQQVRPAES
jgi:hypothetical protein